MYAYAAGSPGTFGGPRQHDLVGPGYGATTTTIDPATGLPVTTTEKDWTDVLSTVLGAGVTLYQTDIQRDAIKAQKHQQQRDAAALREATLDATRVNANNAVLMANMKPRGGVVMAPSGGGGISPMIVVVGVAVVGAAVFFLMPRKRR